MTRLRRSDISSAGLRRIGRGRGFCYRDPGGRTLTADESEWVRHLAIPPAWRDVWISPYPNGHILATGTDEAGRRQYLYHEAWHERMGHEKYDRMLALTAVLPDARKGVTRALRGDGYGIERVLAGAFRMLDTGSLRVGSEQYAREHGSAGLSTLLNAHARVVGGVRVELRFPSKSGQTWESTLDDPDLAGLIRGLKRRGKRARLLSWRHDDGTWHPLSATRINEDIRARLGDEFTAKDFRTLHGTIAAAESLSRTGVQTASRARQRAIARATRDAASVLGNTPAVARASYIDPRVFDAYNRGETIDSRSPRRTVEAQLRRLLMQYHSSKVAQGAS